MLNITNPSGGKNPYLIKKASEVSPRRLPSSKSPRTPLFAFLMQIIYYTAITL